MRGRAILVSLIVLLATATITARADDRVPGRYVPAAEEHAATAGRGLWIDEQQTHPLVLVAIIGFAGVISAQLVNGWLTRRRDDRERRRLAESVAAALAGEMRVFANHIEMIERNVSELRDLREQVTLCRSTFPIPDESIVSRNLDHLGLLGSRFAGRIAVWYGTWRRWDRAFAVSADAEELPDWMESWMTAFRNAARQAVINLRVLADDLDAFTEEKRPRLRAVGDDDTPQHHD